MRIRNVYVRDILFVVIFSYFCELWQIDHHLRSPGLYSQSKITMINLYKLGRLWCNVWVASLLINNSGCIIQWNNVENFVICNSFQMYDRSCHTMDLSSNLWKSDVSSWKLSFKHFWKVLQRNQLCFDSRWQNKQLIHFMTTL